jgi:hypothetical protein
LGDAIEQALVETATITFASANVTLTLSDSNSKQNARALRLNLTGTTAGARDLIVPAIQKPYLVNNGTADTITVKVSGQTGVAVPASTSMLLYNNGTDVIVAFNRVVGNLVGSADTLTTARTIAISGGVTGTATSFDGSANISINATAINVDTATAGTLAVGRGGTGATTLNSEAVIIGNTTGAVKFVAPGTTGNVLTSNGTAWLSQAISAGGDYVMTAYTSPATWTKPAGLKAVKVTVVGAGGNGGTGTAVPDFGVFAGGNGGGGGAAIEYLDAPAIPGPVAVTVGTAPSKTSSFGPFLSATGGTNGSNVASPSAGSVPVGPYAGGSGSGGTFNISGQDGVGRALNPAPGPTGNVMGNMAGASALGFGAGTIPTSGTGISGKLYGGGATGASGTAPAGTGAGGIVIVEEFY